MLGGSSAGSSDIDGSCVGTKVSKLMGLESDSSTETEASLNVIGVVDSLLGFDGFFGGTLYHLEFSIIREMAAGEGEGIYSGDLWTGFFFQPLSGPL
jgi:hypothetical protein